MFKKLKQKISEEQTAPAPRSPSSPPQGPSTSSSSVVRSRTSSLVEQNDEGGLTPSKELLAGMISEPAFLSEYTIFALDPTKRPKPQNKSVDVSKQVMTSTNNGSELSSPQPGDVQSFAQKLQFRVPSMESLFRSPLKESLFRSSSKESLVRTSSRDSLNKLDFDSPGPTFDPPSDVESEAEELPGNADSLPKEQLLQRLRRMERSLGSYRGKYSELITAFQAVQREKKKLQGILSQSQDKALRRIGELREELQMDQQAKKHLQEEFDASLEEKDQLISVLQTQVSLLKERLQNKQICVELPDANDQTQTQLHSPTKDTDAENDLESPGDDGDTAKTLETLTQRVKRQENLLYRCKEKLRLHKEHSAQLANEKEALQEQLDERLQELEKIKDLHMAEKTKLITQLRDAKNLIEQLEQDKGMVIAETKRQMHETLEMKEEEIAQLRANIKQVVLESEELKDGKEKSEKAAFKELERALSAAQRTEEAHKKLQAEMDEKIKAVEKASEEERVTLQRELTKVKQEVVNIMKKSLEERVVDLERLHNSELAKKEQMLNERLQAQDQVFQEQMQRALEKCQREHLQTIQEKEQQGSLALEELELQKKAIELECDKKLEEKQQEVETFKTRILELESSLTKCSPNDKNQLEDLTTQIEVERNKHNQEITAMVEKHREELEMVKQKEQQLWTEKLNILTQEQHAEIEKLERIYAEKLSKVMKDKETIFHAHIEEMNEKTLEKLDVKQTELEALSSELSDALKICEDLEKCLSALQEKADKEKQEFEAKLEEQKCLYKEQTEVAKKAFKEEINHLRLLLEAKEKCQEELEKQIKTLQESLIKAENECKEMSTEVDHLSQPRNDSAREQANIYEQKLTDMQQQHANIKAEKSELEEQIVKTETHLSEVKAELESQISQVRDLKCEMEAQRIENMQKVSSLTEGFESQLRDLREEVNHAKSHCTTKENELQQMKECLNQQIDDLRKDLLAQEDKSSTLKDEYENKLKHQQAQTQKIKDKAREMQETFKKKLSEQEAKLKKEIENKQLELSKKDQEFNSKILEMAHASSIGISEAVSKLEINQKEQLEGLTQTHRQELEEVVRMWENKVTQQAEELQEKHEMELQEKEQEVGDLKQKLATLNAEREGSNAEIILLKDQQSKKDTSINELKEQLQQALGQVDVLTQKETDLKIKLAKLENDFSLSLEEKMAIQEQLNEIKAVEEKEKNKISELADKLKASEEQLEALKSSHIKDCEDYKKRLEDKNLELQQKTTDLEKFTRDTITQLEDYQKKAETLLQTKTSELIEKCNEKMCSVSVRIEHCQEQAIKAKETMLIKMCKIPGLETQLKESTDINCNLTKSLQESKQHLQEKENLIMSMKVDIEGLIADKEQLQKEGGHQQEAATEKETCITQLKKELSEHINVITSTKEELNAKKSEIADLNKLTSELNLRLETSLSDKDATLALLNKQHKENQEQLLNEVQELSSKVEMLTLEKATALEQVDHWMNKMSEWKKKAQSRFTQNHNTIKELQNKVELSNNQACEKDEELSRLKKECDQQSKHLEHLKGLIEQKQIRKEKQESDLVAELKIHIARIAELEEHIARKTAENDSLMDELKKCNEQKNEKNELELRLQQAEVAVVEKDTRIKEMEDKIVIFEKKVQSIEVDIENKSKECEEIKVALTKTKEKELKALEETLTSETTAKIADLKKKAEQKIASIKKQLTSQMEEREQQCRLDMEKQLEQKLQDKENWIMSLEEKIRSRDSEFEKEIIQKAEAVEVSTQQDKTHSLENMQQMYELKIDALQKDLLEKEKLLKAFDEEQKTSNNLKLQVQSQQEELHKRKQGDQIIIEKLQQEIEEQMKKQTALLEQCKRNDSDLANIREIFKSKEQEQQNMENVIKDLQEKLKEKEKEGQSFQQTINSFEECLMKEREKHRIEMGEIISKYDERLRGVQEQLDERSSHIKALEESREEKTRSILELQKSLDDLQTQQKEMQNKLEETEREKQKQHRDLSKLQKDLRALRKEHQQELEIMKKESLEEMEQKIKYEKEDIELKHNSTLKQLMREFNTQLAQKDQELETAVKETISKAQEVESELIESHHAEITQLNKKNLEKDEDLQRTVKKYEEILQSREEEMTEKVNELERQLEEHKQRLADEVIVEDLQVQLAQKTTLLNDSKLQEQEFRERIHTLQDKLKKYEKNMYVTTVESPYREGNLCHSDVSLFGEPTEFEYLRKVFFEYMMGRETKTMAKVITTVLKFPAEQAQKILEREAARTVSWLRPSS
nr:PREDICTED: golgin subfamily A member 4 isoform X2 [Anolis carolinensis]|eukprot:XP_008111019.1 PREDICTED: golgin subfamily A member 4 isoform X2 [Anolis carolinensis]